MSTRATGREGDPYEYDAAEFNDDEDDEGCHLVLDAGRLRWRIGVAGEDGPRAMTDLLTPALLVPVLAAASHGDLAPELLELSLACVAAAAELWPGEQQPSCRPGLARGNFCPDWNCTACKQRHEREGLPALRAAGKTCRAFATELIQLAIRGVTGAAELLWAANCAMLEYFVGGDTPPWAGLPLHVSSDDCLTIIVATPCLQDPESSSLIQALCHAAFASDGPVRRAGWVCPRLVMQPQELLALYGTGRTTGMCVNLGSELSAYAVYEGYALPQCARRRAWGSSGADASTVAAIVAEAIFSAPLDCRMDLINSIILCGGDTELTKPAADPSDPAARWPLQDAVHEALCAEADWRVAVSLGEMVPIWRARHWAKGGHEGSFWLDHPGNSADATCPRLDGPARAANWSVRQRVKLIAPPERALLTWIGGSIVGSINRNGFCPMVLNPGLSEDGMGYTGQRLSDHLMLPDLGPALAAASQRLAWARCAALCDAEMPELAALPLDLVVMIGETHRVTETDTSGNPSPSSCCCL